MISQTSFYNIELTTYLQPYHPSDVINRYLLKQVRNPWNGRRDIDYINYYQVSEADFAITHDKDWWRVMKEVRQFRLDDEGILHIFTGGKYVAERK